MRDVFCTGFTPPPEHYRELRTSRRLGGPVTGAFLPTIGEPLRGAVPPLRRGSVARTDRAVIAGYVVGGASYRCDGSHRGRCRDSTSHARSRPASCGPHRGPARWTR